MNCLAVLVSATTLSIAVVGATNRATQSPSDRVPVLLELFTSEGCSSCPPADKLLQEIDQKQPIVGADLIVLSEHVDYWDHLGWADPSSSPAFTKRQQDYASSFGSDDVYTPQLVVDGNTSLVGNDWPKAENAIKQSLRQAKLPVDVTAERNNGGALVHISVSRNSAKQTGAIYLAIARNHTESHVARGENAGRALSHVAVAYSIQQITTLKPGVALQKDLRVSLPPDSRAGDTRLIVFARESGTPRIIGVAQTRL